RGGRPPPGGPPGRCALAKRFSPRGEWRGCSTASPSAVLRNTVSPPALPVSCPVRGSGRIGTSAHENPTYQPSACCDSVTVLGVPSSGRLHRTASRPIVERTRKPFSSVAPLPNCL